MNTLYEKINFLCEKNGIKPGKMCSDISVQRSMISDLKHGRKQSLNLDVVMKIANYFGVSLDYLLGNEKAATPEGDGYTDDERSVIEFYRNDPDFKSVVDNLTSLYKNRIKEGIKKRTDNVEPSP